jgi:antibiotic biosynthesis monooxygenase (ABM) superfamily enzyme
MTTGKDTKLTTHTTAPTPESVTPGRIPPPSKHQLAVMIWLCVFPTLTALNLVLGHWLVTFSPVLRTFVLATIAVPIVIYGLMPHLHRVRTRLLATRTARTH